MSNSAYRSTAQGRLLEELMEKEKELCSGKFSRTFTTKDAKMKWIEIAKKLNAVPGATKDWRHWRKSWQDFRCKRKTKLAALAKRAGGVISDHSKIKDPALTSDDDDYSTVEGDVFEDPITISFINTENLNNSTPEHASQQRRRTSSLQDDLESLEQRKLEIRENYYKRKLQIMERQAAALEKIANTFQLKQEPLNK